MRCYVRPKGERRERVGVIRIRGKRREEGWSDKDKGKEGRGEGWSN